MPVKYQKFLERVQNGKIFLWDLVFCYPTHFCCMKKSSNLRSCSSSVLHSLRAQTSQDSKKSWMWLKQPTSYFCLLKSADVSGVCFGSNSLQLTGKLVDKVVAVRWVKKNSEMNNIGWTWLYMRNVLYQQGMVVLMCTGEQVGRSYHHAETGGVWEWVTFPSKRSTEIFEPRPTCHKITEFLKLEKTHEGLSSPTPSSSQNYLKLSDRTESVVQTDPLAKTSPATNTWSCSGCKTCPCVLQHLKPLTNLF